MKKLAGKAFGVRFGLERAVKAIRAAPRWEKVYLCGDALEQVLRWAETVEKQMHKSKQRK